MGLKISAVIPANNEQSTVGDIVEGCKQYCDEVIVVDDASSDLTSEIARRAGAKVTRNAIRLGIKEHRDWSTVGIQGNNCNA